jgi:predicted nucleic acid-binding protein
LILYLDTSALVKLYAEEEGSERVRHGVRAADLIATSLMAYAEMRSALARRSRNSEISRPAFTRCRRNFERDWQRLNRLPIDELLVRKAGELAEQHALRALDALHLASADSLQTALRDGVTFACFDSRLNGAAEAQGFALLTHGAV